MSTTTRSRSTSDHFLPAEGEDFLGTKEVDAWIVERGLVMWRLEKMEATQKEEKTAEDLRHSELGTRVSALELDAKYQTGKIIGGVLVASFLISLLMQYLQVFG